MWRILHLRRQSSPCQKVRSVAAQNREAAATRQCLLRFPGEGVKRRQAATSRCRSRHPVGGCAVAYRVPGVRGSTATGTTPSRPDATTLLLHKRKGRGRTASDNHGMTNKLI